MRTLKISVIGLALLAGAGAAGAQSNAWYNPYIKGVRAVESARYAEGATLLERAVAEDPRAARNKYIEGVFRTDYVPYFYLAIAYTRLGQFDKATANAAKAAIVLPPDLAPRFADLRRELEAEPAALAAAGSTPPAAPTPKPAPAPPRATATAPSSIQPARQVEADALKGDVITTTGQASVRRPPDVAFLTVGVETRAKSPRDAQRQNADEAAAMQRRLNDAGISRDALRTLGVDLQQEFDFNQGRRTPRDYVARNTIEVRVEDVGRVGEIVDAAVQGGATSTGGVRFDLRDRATAERDAVRLAVADARSRAEAAATGAGRTIGRILRIEESREDTIVMARPMFAAAAAQAPTPTPVDPGYVEVRARVTLTASMR
jgi:uncharacterized protein YggE